MAEAATLDEIKDRIRKRVGKRSPFHLMDPTEAEGALADLTSLEPDAWAEVWSKAGARLGRDREGGGGERKRR